MKKFLITMAVAGTLAGCGTMNQAVNAYGTIAIDNAQHANDTIIASWSVAACATPLSAIMRNPQIIPALRLLCLPAGDVSAGSLLDAKKP